MLGLPALLTESIKTPFHSSSEAVFFYTHGVARSVLRTPLATLRATRYALRTTLNSELRPSGFALHPTPLYRAHPPHFPPAGSLAFGPSGLVPCPSGLVLCPSGFVLCPSGVVLCPSGFVLVFLGASGLRPDRALVNQAPEEPGLGPSGFDPSLASLGLRGTYLVADFPRFSLPSGHHREPFLTSLSATVAGLAARDT